MTIISLLAQILLLGKPLDVSGNAREEESAGSAAGLGLLADLAFWDFRK